MALRGAASVLALTLAVAVVASAAHAQPHKPRPRCTRADPACIAQGGNGLDEYNFLIKGNQVLYRFSDSSHFKLRCPENLTLDEPALPRFDSELRVRSVELQCAPPAAPRSYHEALRALNVTALERLVLRGGARLSASHLSALPWLRDLLLDGVALEPDSRDLRSLTRLMKLRIQKVALSTADLELLPIELQHLDLVSTGVREVPAAVFAARHALTRVLLQDNAPLSVQPAGALRSLTVQSERVSVGATLPPTLANLTLWGWAEPFPAPWAACAGLVELRLDDVGVAALPRGWVSACSSLRVLTVKNARNRTLLEEGALVNATALEVLHLVAIQLDALPKGLLDHAPRLSSLNLSQNRLHVLPSGLFALTLRLQVLVLSENRLTGAALSELAPLSQLSLLRVAQNAALDACPAGGAALFDTLRRSWLPQLRNLEELDVSDTATARLCADWRELPALRLLGMRGTALEDLSFPDFDFNTASDVSVDLVGANVSHLYFNRKQYEDALNGRSTSVKVLLSEALVCDCQLYWAALALRNPATWLTVVGARCGDGRALHKLRPDELTCPAPGRCVANCSCAVLPDQRAPYHRLRVQCEGGELSRVPRVDVAAALNASAPVALELCLANNRINLLAPEDLPPHLASLDLRNNQLNEINSATADALVAAPERRVLLAGNRLECGCGAAGLRAAARAHLQLFADHSAVRCTDGSSLAAAALAEPACGSIVAWAAWGAGLVLVVTPGVALALAMWRSELRLRLKAALRARGWLPRVAEPEDGRPYDAFVSFAHADEPLVRELVARLEAGAAPLRLCVHYRDWVPGGWIVEQIHASVRAARRTVLVVSAAFVRSDWARAEFRAAHAAALRDAEPRLVVVLLDEPARLPLDAELRAYLAANTYVRWGDPWFWDKLRRALPPPRSFRAACADDPGPAPPPLRADA